MRKRVLNLRKVLLPGMMTLVIGLFTAGTVMAAETIPNLLGTWESRIEKNYQHSAGKGHKSPHDQVFIVVEGQQGRAFFGHKEKFINKKMVEKEKFSGVIYFDDKTIYTVDHEKGVTHATLESPTEIRGVHMVEGPKAMIVLFTWKKIK